jgi:hypothetical protein
MVRWWWALLGFGCGELIGAFWHSWWNLVPVLAALTLVLFWAYHRGGEAGRR